MAATVNWFCDGCQLPIQWNDYITQVRRGTAGIGPRVGSDKGGVAWVGAAEEYHDKCIRLEQMSR